MVDEILKIKNKNFNGDVYKYEGKINKIVYGLYGLSEEEVRMIEIRIKINKNNGYYSFSISSILNPVCSDINLLSSPEFFKLLAIA